MEKVVIERNGVRHHLVLDSIQTEFYCSVCSLADLCYGMSGLRLCNVFRFGKRCYHFELEK